VQPQQQPPEPQPTPTPPTPDETPSTEPSPVPTPNPPKPKHTIKVDLTPVHSATHTTHHTDTTARDQEREEQQQEDREARAEARRRAAALHNLTSSLENNLSSRTDVALSGSSRQATANYGQIVSSVYHAAWVLPDHANSEAIPKVHVVIGRDGSVISARITEPSGDAAVDESVQRVLDRVRFVQAFPEGMNEESHSYNINFDVKTKEMSE
jgi:TonB family protein